MATAPLCQDKTARATCTADEWRTPRMGHCAMTPELMNMAVRRINITELSGNPNVPASCGDSCVWSREFQHAETNYIVVQCGVRLAAGDGGGGGREGAAAGGSNSIHPAPLAPDTRNKPGGVKYPSLFILGWFICQSCIRKLNH
ncbi:hypothetical protein E2C01_028224 [Portunus trituberculatus]|uniref:Uncharacterized protein n=1 Tax=Portunus trituberculatus TaxID=210409 RepID=A0A5B7EK31_PORTR|nr:hypothetical protein [Portunus trituberculatus]